jgi:CBS domain-containing protein
MENNKFTEVQSRRRFQLSIVLVTVSLGILVTVSALLFFFGDGRDSADTVFTAIVGLVGAWIGTILAFYFSKDNFEAASKATQDLVVQLTGEQRLQAVTVEEAMIKLDSMNYYVLKEGDEDKVLLDDLIKEFKNFNRLPVLDKSLKPVYIIHKSIVSLFISQCALGQHPDVKKEIKQLTMKDMISVEVHLNQIKNGFVTVRPGDNLAVAKKEMEANKQAPCSDIFVTEKGTTDSKVIGWITNQIINEKSKV